jgi:hypothetical protein
VLRFKTGHGIKPAASDDADFCCQWISPAS